MKYGRMQIRSKMPAGDWLWSGIWMLPKDDHYGHWPASGEIDLLESVGNGLECDKYCRNKFKSHLHFGPH